MDKITEVLERSVAKIYPSKKELEKLLRSGKKIKLYQGFDPTGTQLHIGHAVAMQKFRQFQELGHEVIFLIGDGTGQAGDPSGKTRAREKFHTQKELKENARDYVKQAGKIVKFDGPNPVKILFNSEWLNKLTLVDILDIAQHFTIQQLIERDMFERRMKKGEPINLREFIYPLLQGYDSVVMKVDLELGGTDQTFNMLCGRQLAKTYLNKEKFVLTMPLITDAQGIKIGKTEGNVIALVDNPNNTYGQIMSLPDEVIGPTFEGCTDLDWDEVKKIQKELKKSDTNPMKYKKKLAWEMVRMLHDKKAADQAQKNFEQVVQEKGIPDKIKELTVSDRESLLDLVSKADPSLSRSEAKRLIKQGGVAISDKIVKDPQQIVEIKDGSILRVGKRGFYQIKK